MLLSSNTQVFSGHVALVDYGKLNFVAAPYGTIYLVGAEAAPAEFDAIRLSATSLSAVEVEGEQKWQPTSQVDSAAQLINESLVVDFRGLQFPAEVSYFNISTGSFVNMEKKYTLRQRIGMSFW